MKYLIFNTEKNKFFKSPYRGLVSDPEEAHSYEADDDIMLKLSKLHNIILIPAKD